MQTLYSLVHWSVFSHCLDNIDKYGKLDIDALAKEITEKIQSLPNYKQHKICSE